LRLRARPASVIKLCLLTLAALCAPDTTGAFAGERSSKFDKGTSKIGTSLALHGKHVHNVGNLQMNVTNWGFFGSMPDSRYPMSESPSAQWPAGSGVEYLYAAGIWVGALINGIPAVSTAYPETEFFPPKGDVYTIYRSSEGALGGDHYPDQPDDDVDGRIDEDWLNGLDDDSDGFVDEDFASYGTQMFTCWYTDDQDEASIVYPEHTPMNIGVRQESYQWAEKGDDEYVAVRYFIENLGNTYLTDVYVGIYADFDAGPRHRSNYHMDDMVGFYRGYKCAPIGDQEIPVYVKVAYVYDNDGDDGETPGYFGISLINYPVYSWWSKREDLNVLMPVCIYCYFNAIKNFRSLMPYTSGGEPTNDRERYESLSGYTRDDDSDSPADYKVLVSVGPLALKPGDEPFVLDVAFVAGEGLDGMLQSAANATARFRGCWIDRDNDPLTGIMGRETKVIGPIVGDWYPDPCFYPEEYLRLRSKEVCWSNIDCGMEKYWFEYPGCYKTPDAKLWDFQTGIRGQEYQVHWVSGTAPPPPKMRAVAGDHVITVLWDNFSEVVPDPFSRKYDFEGYQIWRAADWHRPLGTSMITGPQRHLWQFLEGRDLVNGLEPDVDFKRPFSEGGWTYEPLPDLENRDQLIEMFEEMVQYAPIDTVPCPPGLRDEQCDTLEAIARFNLGYEGGRQYYKYVDSEVKNGLMYFYSVTTCDHKFIEGVPALLGRYSTPGAQFVCIEPRTEAQVAEAFESDEIYVVPNPVTMENMEPWRLFPNNNDPSGLKCEFRNLPRCISTVRIYTVAGDLVETLHHDGSNGEGSLSWNLLSRNGQEVVSGVYLFSVEPHDGRFARTVGKFVIIR